MKNRISSFAHLSPNAQIGTGNIIKVGAIIYDDVIIGNNNYIGEYTTIGTAGECREGAPPEGFKTIIGDDNIIREYVSIQAPVRGDLTRIGNKNYIMNKSHIAHDCEVGDNCTIATFACLGGCVKLGNWSNVGLAAMIHQRLKIEEGCMIGMNATITKDVQAWKTMVGVNQFLKINETGQKKAGWTQEMIDEFFKKNFVLYFPL